MSETESGTRQFSSASLGAVIAGRYRLLNLIGEGGMGQVFEAEHLALGRPFALKVLRLEKWSDELVQRFQREARALARIDSPRVAQVTDYGIEEHIGPYYVMELVRGETLEHRIERTEGLHVDEALHIAAESAEALAEVHDAGIVHRDVKPSNLGLPSTGPVAVKLLDFGLAASIDDSFMQRLTKSQQVLGSLPYMAPEQFHGARPQPQMDVYAIGVVLFEMLSGRLPFKAPSTAALIHQILAAPVPSFDQVAPQTAVPPRVEQVVRKLLAKDPAHRFASAREAAAAIRQTAEGSLASTLPGRQELPRTRYQPEVVVADLPVASDASAPSSPNADTVAMPAPTPSGRPAPLSDDGTDPAVAETQSGDAAQGWPSGQVVPPTSYAAEAPGRGRGPTVALLLGGGILVGALAAIAIVLVLDAGGPPAEPQPAGSGPSDVAGAQASAADGALAAGPAADGSDATDGSAAGDAEPGDVEPDDAPREHAEQASVGGDTEGGSEPTARRDRPTRRGGGSGGPSRTTMRAGSMRTAPEPWAAGSAGSAGEDDEPTMAAAAMDEDTGGGTWQGEVIEQPEF